MTENDLRVLRACFALSEAGDWDQEAVKRELESSGMTPSDAEAAIEAAIASGSIVVSEPEAAVVIPIGVKDARHD